MQDFRRLNVWSKAMEVAREVYRATAGFPAGERFGLTSQMRRAAVSVAANIAEGCGRDTDPDTRRFLQIAMGSACELECEVALARELAFLTPSDAAALTARITEAKKMLSSLILAIRRRVRARSET